MCLAQGHNAVRPVRFKSAAPRSLVKHSTTALPQGRRFLKFFDKSLETLDPQGGATLGSRDLISRIYVVDN